MLKLYELSYVCHDKYTVGINELSCVDYKKYTAEIDELSCGDDGKYTVGVGELSCVSDKKYTEETSELSCGDDEKYTTEVNELSCVGDKKYTAEIDELSCGDDGKYTTEIGKLLCSNDGKYTLEIDELLYVGDEGYTVEMDEYEFYRQNYVIEHQPIDLFLTNKDYIDFLSDYVFEKKYTSHLYFSIFIFYEKFFQTPIFFFNRTCYNNLHNDVMARANVCYLQVFRLYKKVAKKFRIFNFIYALVSAFLFKDLTLLKNFLIEKLKKIAFKKHKRMLSMFRYAFALVTSFMIRKKYMLGFKMYISGKIGVAGSTKKKTWYYRNGLTAISSKDKNLKYEVFQTWTRTGCLGFRIYLAF